MVSGTAGALSDCRKVPPSAHAVASVGRAGVADVGGGAYGGGDDARPH